MIPYLEYVWENSLIFTIVKIFAIAILFSTVFYYRYGKNKTWTKSIVIAILTALAVMIAGLFVLAFNFYIFDCHMATWIICVIILIVIASIIAKKK